MKLAVIKSAMMAMMLSVIHFPILGATVIENPFAWDCSRNDEKTGVFNIEWYAINFVAGSSVWIDVAGNFTVNGRHTTMTADGGFPEFIGNWVEAEYGTKADATTLRNIDRYFVHSDLDGNTGAETYNVEIDKDTTTYLAFCGEVLGGESMSSLVRTGVYLYGWVSLTIDENGVPKVTGSAIDLDGGPMVVGGGAWEGNIPEPCGGILFLLGAAVLGLRRRMDRSTHVRFRRRWTR